MAKKYLEELSDFVEKAAADLDDGAHLECKHFFSGAALYANDRICVTLTPVGLGMKLPEATVAKLLKNGKGKPLRYFPKAPIKKAYVLFPDGVAKGGKRLPGFVNESIGYVLTLPKPKRKK